MDRELQDWLEKTMPLDRLHNSVIRGIVLSVWPDAESMSPRELGRLYGDVRDILDGFPTPTRSAKERAAVLALKPIPSEVP